MQARPATASQTHCLVSYVQFSEGSFQVVCPLGLWSRTSRVVNVLSGSG